MIVAPTQDCKDYIMKNVAYIAPYMDLVILPGFAQLMGAFRHEMDKDQVDDIFKVYVSGAAIMIITQNHIKKAQEKEFEKWQQSQKNSKSTSH